MVVVAFHSDQVKVVMQVDHLVERPGRVDEIVFELALQPTAPGIRRICAGVAAQEPWALAVLNRLAPEAVAQVLTTVSPSPSR